MTTLTKTEFPMYFGYIEELLTTKTCVLCLWTLTMASWPASSRVEKKNWSNRLSQTKLSNLFDFYTKIRILYQTKPNHNKKIDILLLCSSHTLILNIYYQKLISLNYFSFTSFSIFIFLIRNSYNYYIICGIKFPLIYVRE